MLKELQNIMISIDPFGTAAQKGDQPIDQSNVVKKLNSWGQNRDSTLLQLHYSQQIRIRTRALWALTGFQCAPFTATVDVVYTWKYGGPHILNTVYANEMKLCVYNAYVLKGWWWGMAALLIENSFEYTKSNSLG